MPPRTNRRRQVRTVATAQPTRLAISALDTPACANSAILARRTSACGEDARRTIASSLALRRAPNTTVSRLAARAMIPPEDRRMITQSAVRRIGFGADAPNGATLAPCPCPPSASKS